MIFNSVCILSSIPRKTVLGASICILQKNFACIDNPFINRTIERNQKVYKGNPKAHETFYSFKLCTQSELWEVKNRKERIQSESGAKTTTTKNGGG